MELGEALKLLRIFNEYKAKDFAKKLDISQSYLSEIENGKKKPSLEILEKYSKVLDIKVSTLLYFSETLKEDKEKNVKRTTVEKGMNLLRILDKLNGDDK